MIHSPVASSQEGLDDDGELVFDDVEVAGHGWEDKKERPLSDRRTHTSSSMVIFFSLTGA